MCTWLTNLTHYFQLGRYLNLNEGAAVRCVRSSLLSVYTAESYSLSYKQGLCLLKEFTTITYSKLLKEFDERSTG